MSGELIGSMVERASDEEDSAKEKKITDYLSKSLLSLKSARDSRHHVQKHIANHPGVRLSINLSHFR